ncbi:hypothetical protein SCHPADRAFT_896685 [Schizopora paradoxa]|uniref:Chromatin elongation factor SPT5 n=1 Tax=Schizopora paradoxa TaxID=27342 RepID=A0A0H2QZT8_9AGAM|nr:hypothetical protein SCHPADRAFT_896685 [Schizopora paradoxa]
MAHSRLVEEIEEMNLPRAALLPCHDDLMVYEVRVKRGTEIELVVLTYQKVSENESWQPGWGSVFTLPGIPGRIYAEVKDSTHFDRLFEHYVDAFTNQASIVPVEERLVLISSHRQKVLPTVGSWVEVKFGLHAGDHGVLESIDDQSSLACVRVPARVPDPNRRKRSHGSFLPRRPPPKLFTHDEAVSRFGRHAISDFNPFTFRGLRYTCDGFRLLSISPYSIRPSRPRLDDIALFLEVAAERLRIENHDDGYVPTELEIFRRAGIPIASLAIPSFLKENDRVKFCIGALAGSYGRVIDTPVFQVAHVEVDTIHTETARVNSLPIVAEDVKNLTRVYQVGDSVVVRVGVFEGRCGFVQFADEESVILAEDSSSKPISVPVCYVDYGSSGASSVKTMGIVGVKPSPPDPPMKRNLDHHILEFVGRKVYVWKGKFKGKIGEVKAISGLSAKVTLNSSLALGGSSQVIRREYLVTSSMETLLTGKPPILTAEAFIMFSNFLNEVLVERQATPPPYIINDDFSNNIQDVDVVPNHDRYGHSMWLFEPEIAKQRANWRFVVHIDNHPSAKIAGIKTGRVAIDENPPVFPLSVSQAAEVMVEFTDARSNTMQELLPVKDITAKHTKAGLEHIIISGPRIGMLVLHVRNDKTKARVYEPGKDKRKEGFYVEQEELCYTKALNSGTFGELRYTELKRIPTGSLGAYLQQHKHAVHIKEAKRVNKETTVKETGFKLDSFKGACKRDHFYVVGINPGKAGRITVRCTGEICHKESRLVAKAPEPALRRIERDAITIKQLICDENEENKRQVVEVKRIKKSKKAVEDVARDAKRRAKAILRAERELNEAKLKAVKAASVATEARLKARTAVEAANLEDAKAIQASIIRLEKWEALKELDPDNGNTIEFDEPMQPQTSDFASSDAQSPLSTAGSEIQSISENAQSSPRKRKRYSVSETDLSDREDWQSSEDGLPDYLTQPVFTSKHVPVKKVKRDGSSVHASNRTTPNRFGGSNVAGPSTYRLNTRDLGRDVIDISDSP